MFQKAEHPGAYAETGRRRMLAAPQNEVSGDDE